MKMKAYHRSILCELRSSKARFISILAIIFLGVAFYAGVKSAGPAMKDTIEQFYNEQALMDSKVVSSLGLTEEDIALLDENPEIVSYYASRSIDVNVTNENKIVRFMEYDKMAQENMNRLLVVEGRLPENSGEIVIDAEAKMKNPHLEIGGTYTIESDESTMESFKTTSYTIVGFVKSPLYIERISRGTTNVGKGSIDYFACVPAEDLDMEVYTELYISFQNVVGLGAYTDEYKTKMEVNGRYLEELFGDRQIERVEQLKSDANEEIANAEEEITDGEEKLAEAKSQIVDGKEELEQGKIDYEKAVKAYEDGLVEASQLISDNEKKLKDGQEELNQQKETLEEGKEKLAEGKKELEEARKTFSDQGVDPDQSLTKLEKQITGMTSLISSYDGLAKEIKNTIAGLTEGEVLEAETIARWRLVLEEAGMTELLPLISAVEANPADSKSAWAIVAGLEQAVSAAQESQAQMNTLLEGLTAYQSGKKEYETNAAKIAVAEQEIKKAQSTLESGKSELEKAKAQYESGKKEGKEKLEEAKAKLEDAEVKIADAEKEVKENELKLADARTELADAKDKVAELDKGKYYFFDRKDNPGYAEFEDVIERIAAIASVFPLVFFIVAVLICLTTMTRMVEENRTEIGTLKALGYSNGEIAKKYIVYSAAASIAGGILGILIGSQLFPNVIVSAYGTMYTLPKLPILFYSSYIIQAMVLAVLCTVGASLVVLKMDLASNPSTLMRPKAPRVGKKILLERIKPLWRRLNFNQKVTFRNLFRYKQRMVMTVFGIAACTAMMITGFGLKDSISDLTNKQFQKLWKYQVITVFDDEAEEEATSEYEQVLEGLPEYEDSINVHQETVTFEQEGMNKQTVTLYVPEDTQKLKNFVLLNDRRSGTEYEIPTEGALINEKLAKLLGVSEGEEISMTDNDGNQYTMVIAHITESYLAHALYVSPEYYEAVFGNHPSYNSQFVKMNVQSSEMDFVAKTLMGCEKVINVSFIDTVASTSEEAMSSLNIVIIILIVAAGGLAFVVLYNLNNINVSERIRELSTIKVLGFYDMEVSMYIVRENVILTFLGIAVGIVLGKVLHGFVSHTAEADNMMMSPNIFLASYVYSIVLTIVFSMVVMLLMHRKLKKVDMIDALKSTE